MSLSTECAAALLSLDNLVDIIIHGLLAKNGSSLSKRDTNRQNSSEFLVIYQSELERNKFGSIVYCFILKAKEIIAEPNI